MAKMSPIKRKSKLSTPRLVSTRSIISFPTPRHPLLAQPHPRSHPKKRGDPISYMSRSVLWRGALKQNLRGPGGRPARQRRSWAPQPERMRQTRHDHGTSLEYRSLDQCARPLPEPCRSSQQLSRAPTALVCQSPLSPLQPAPLESALRLQAVAPLCAWEQEASAVALRSLDPTQPEPIEDGT